VNQIVHWHDCRIDFCNDPWK